MILKAIVLSLCLNVDIKYEIAFFVYINVFYTFIYLLFLKNVI